MTPRATILNLVAILSFFFTYGCATNTIPFFPEPEKTSEISPSAYHNIEIAECEQIDTAGMVKKVDNFMLIFDPSASMSETYVASKECSACHQNYQNEKYAENHAIEKGGREFAKHGNESHDSLNRCTECHQDFMVSKFVFAKNIANCFNQTIPDIDITSSLRLFGYPTYTSIIYGPEKYKKETFARVLRKIDDAGGASPLNQALNATSKDLFKTNGKKAVVIISDGKDMDKKEVIASEELKARYGEDICIYTITIGSDLTGISIMDKIATAGQCGEAINADFLLDKTRRDTLIREIFLTPSAPPAKAEPADSDKDGVPDDKDDCPKTTAGLDVDENGCWKLIVAADILFDFDKYNLKQEGQEILDQVVANLNKYPFLKLSLAGHTDNRGSMEYNTILSQKRTEAGLKYLIDKGIDPQRVTLSWHSFSFPRASNDTKEGRQLNRRLEFKFSK